MNKPTLLQQGLILEYLTLTWNIIGCILLLFVIKNHSLSLFGFGVDSAIEILASTVVVWQLRKVSSYREHVAEKIIGVSFVFLSVYILASVYGAFIHRSVNDISVLGGVWLLITALVMCILSYGKSVVGKKLENRVLITEARVTVIDGLLAVAMLVGMLAQIAFGWWWVDAITSLVIVGYGLWEAVHVLGVRIATLLFVASAATAYGVLFFYTPEKLTPQYRTSRVLESYTAKLTDHDLVIQKSAARIVWSEDKTGYYSRLSDASLLDYAALKYYSDDVALVQFLAPKDCGGVDTFVVDIKKKKVLSEKHHSNIMLFVTQGYFFFGQLGAQELVGSYTYGARDFTVFDDSKLSPGETFSNTISDMCPSLGRFATTSDSLTVEYYKQNDFDYSHKAPLRDNVAGGYYFKKQGEKRFHLAP